MWVWCCLHMRTRTRVHPSGCSGLLCAPRPHTVSGLDLPWVGQGANGPDSGDMPPSCPHESRAPSERDPVSLAALLSVLPVGMTWLGIFSSHSQLPVTWSVRGHHCGWLLRHQPHSQGPGVCRSHEGAQRSPRSLCGAPVMFGGPPCPSGWPCLSPSFSDVWYPHEGT